LANTVSDRCDTATTVDRLDSNATVLSWFRSTGLLSKSDAKGLLANPDGEIVRPLVALREAAWATLLAAAEGRSLAARPLREILTAAAAGLPEGSVLPGETNSLPAAGLVPKRAEDLTGLMALQVLDASSPCPETA
jgi:predicted RNA-binding Zn ribbon-like protein